MINLTNAMIIWEREREREREFERESVCVREREAVVVTNHPPSYVPYYYKTFSSSLNYFP